MNQHLVHRQMEGLPLCSENESKAEYHLKTKSGKLVAVVSDEERVGTFIEERIAKHGDKVAPLSVFRVTTITEKL